MAARYRQLAPATPNASGQLNNSVFIQNNHYYKKPIEKPMPTKPKTALVIL